MAREYFVVDAFTSTPWSGNAAAVVLDAEGMSDPEMANVAAEFNLSETTFVLPPSDTSRRDRVRFRWFTPTVEVTMCGHATVAGTLALARSGRWREYGLANPETGAVAWPVETRSGVLTAFCEPLPGQAGESMIWLDLVDPQISDVSIPLTELSSILGVETVDLTTDVSPMRSQDDDLVVFIRDVGRLNNCRPDFAALGDWCRGLDIRGLCVATTHTLSPTIHVQSRFFAPVAGINEDPVTGSVHGPLAAIAVGLGLGLPGDEVTALTCVQGIPDGRTGLVHALVQSQPGRGYAVRIGGRAVVTMRGTLQV